VVYPRDKYWVQFCLTPSFIFWMMEQSVTSASVQMVQNWEVWLICQRIILPPVEPQQAGEMGGQQPHEVEQCEMQSLASR